MLIYSYLINIYITGGYIMIIMTAMNGKQWKVYGINVIPSDSIYQRILEVINRALQGGTGHRAPIIIDTDHRTISFERF